MRQPLRNERGALLIVATVHDGYVVRIGAPIDPNCPRVPTRIGLRTGREVPVCAIGRFQADLAETVELRRIRIQRPFSLPIVEDARGPLALLHRLAPVSRRQISILSPRAAGHFERAAAVARNL